jgi:hypothetical protein
VTGPYVLLRPPGNGGAVRSEGAATTPDRGHGAGVAGDVWERGLPALGDHDPLAPLQRVDAEQHGCATADRLGVGDLPLAVLRFGLDVPDPDGSLALRHGVGVRGAVLVRPDGFVAWRAPNPSGDRAGAAPFRGRAGHGTR